MTKLTIILLASCLAFAGCTKKDDASAPAATTETSGGAMTDSADPAAKYNECMTAATTDEAKKNCESLKPAQ